MSKFKQTIKSENYWILKGQGQIFKMLNDELNDRGDNAKLAEKMGVTPGYISQIMNGDSEINPTWKKIVKLCLSLGKVPILEIKNIDKYIEEQSFRANTRNFILAHQSGYNNDLKALPEYPFAHNLAELVYFKKDTETLSYVDNKEQSELV